MIMMCEETDKKADAEARLLNAIFGNNDIDDDGTNSESNWLEMICHTALKYYENTQSFLPMYS